MKKLLLMAVAVSLVAVSAVAQEVKSRNAVGYVKCEVDSGKTYLMCVNFESITGEGLIGDFLDPVTSGLPGGTTIYFWDPVGQGYSGSETLSPLLGRWDPGTSHLDLGQAFWLRVPANPATNYTFYIMGQVPSDADLVVPILTGVNFASFSFPVETAVNDLGLTDVPGGTTIYYFDPDTGWKSETWSPLLSAWDPGTAVFAPAQGLMIRTTAAGDWNQVKPYDWP